MGSNSTCTPKQRRSTKHANNKHLITCADALGHMMGMHAVLNLHSWLATQNIVLTSLLRVTTML